MTTATTTEKDRAEKYDATDLKALRENLTDGQKELREIRGAIVVEGKNVAVTTEQKDALRAAVNKVEETRELIDTIERGEKALSWLDQPDGRSSAAGADAATEQQRKMLEALAASDRKTLGEMFTESEVYQEMQSKHLSETPRPFEIKMRNIGRLSVPTLVERKEDGSIVETKDIYTAAGGTFTVNAFGQTQNDGLIVPAYRTMRVRDLFPRATTTAAMIEYIRRTGYVNNARVVAERTSAAGGAATGGSTDVFGLKPPSNLTFTTEQAPVRVIAHTIDVSKTVLDDEPRLQETINNEMLYGLRLTEDAELMFGDGTGNHIKGIMNVASIQFYNGAAGPASDYMADTIRRSLTLVMLAYYESTGVVLHPFDWEAMELEKDEQGRYVIVTNVTVGAEQRIWRNPVVATPAMTQGQFLAGAFGLGAKLYDREQANIAISTETRDLFDRNAIAIRAEERVALEVGRPEAFVKGTFAP